MSLKTRTVNCRHVCYRTDAADTPRIIGSHDEELMYRILYMAHDTALSGHLGREKTYSSVSQNYWWPKLYKWVTLMCTHVRRANGSNPRHMRLRRWLVCLYPLGNVSPSLCTSCLAYRRIRVAAQALWSLSTFRAKWIT